MSCELALDDIVTEFLLKTCRLCPRSKSKHAIEAAVRCVSCVVRPEVEDTELSHILLTTGSVAEFYIEPMLPYISDIDLMCHRNTQLAIPRGHPPPTQLPAEFHSNVKVHEIIDSDFPGYVYLGLRYLLTECSDDDQYNAIEYDRRFIWVFASQYSSSSMPMAEIHGPAVTYRQNESKFLPFDTVLCVRCLSWPLQAADWPTRHRNYGWPDSATLDRVVSSGCDVVRVAHHQCRQHEVMGKYQHRLSFSRAEIVLVNSWMPVQQIVYHMLRYFMKTERLVTD